MARILLIESATATCSVALAACGIIVGERTSKAGNDHSAKLTVFISEILESLDLTMKEIDAIAVSMGPGSYTGLRIGVSVAKGLCYSADKPLISVHTLEAMVAGYIEQYDKAGFIAAGDLFCPMIDARRMEVYSEIYTAELKSVRETLAEIIDNASFEELLQSHRVHFFGSGAAKTADLLSVHANAVIVKDFEASASHMIQIARRKYAMGAFEDVAYFEPFYLKDFVAARPKVKGLKS